MEHGIIRVVCKFLHIFARSTYWLEAVADARTILGRLQFLPPCVPLERDRNHKMKFCAWV